MPFGSEGVGMNTGSLSGRVAIGAYAADLFAFIFRVKVVGSFIYVGFLRGEAMKGKGSLPPSLLLARLWSILLQLHHSEPFLVRLH